jgi:recombination protein RecA
MSKDWMSKLTKDFGCSAADFKKEKAAMIPTWSPSLNWALTTGGWTAGKINVLYGPESCGKSMLAMMAIVQLQRQDKEALSVWFDSEFSFAPNFFEKLGGDLKRLVLRRSNDPLKIFDWIAGDMLEAIQDGAPIKCIVIDSIKSIRYPKDIKKESTNQTMGGTGSSYLPSAFKMILPVIAEHEIFTFLIQQVTMQIDTIKAMRNPYVLTEGQALKHASDTMLEITKQDTKAGTITAGETIAGGDAQVGHTMRVKVKKNRLGPPARVAQFQYHYDRFMINAGEEIFSLAKALGVISKKDGGRSLFFNNVSLGKGEQDAKDNLEKDLALQKKILEACYLYRDISIKVDSTGFVEETEHDVLEE